MAKYDIIQRNVNTQALVIQNAITLQANSTISTPLMKEFSKTSILEAFLSSTLLVIIFFLAILSS
jgi:uncharacterized protein with GYD domain